MAHVCPWWLVYSFDNCLRSAVHSPEEMFCRYVRPGMTVLDLGAAPGSWSQYAAKKAKRVIALDLTEIEPIADNVECHAQDITDLDGVGSVVKDKVDVILADLSPKTSGIKDVDQWRSIELNQAVEAIAKSFLRPGGTCVMKVFRGADYDDFLKGLKRNWKVKTAQVKASRDRSREIYLLLTS